MRFVSDQQRAAVMAQYRGLKRGKESLGRRAGKYIRSGRLRQKLEVIGPLAMLAPIAFLAGSQLAGSALAKRGYKGFGKEGHEAAMKAAKELYPTVFGTQKKEIKPLFTMKFSIGGKELPGPAKRFEQVARVKMRSLDYPDLSSNYFNAEVVGNQKIVQRTYLPYIWQRIKTGKWPKNVYSRGATSTTHKLAGREGEILLGGGSGTSIAAHEMGHATMLDRTKFAAARRRLWGLSTPLNRPIVPFLPGAGMLGAAGLEFGAEHAKTRKQQRYLTGAATGLAIASGAPVLFEEAIASKRAMGILKKMGQSPIKRVGGGLNLATAYSTYALGIGLPTMQYALETIEGGTKGGLIQTTRQRLRQQQERAAKLREEKWQKWLGVKKKRRKR